MLTWALFAAAWSVGWLLLWSPRRLPHLVEERPRLAIIVPARDEAESLPHLLEPLVSQLRPGDELLVVDDDSTDTTAAVAASLGATVVPAPPLPAGWIGKPNACWTGANRSTAQLLVFLDADVRPGADLLDGLAAALSHDPDVVVSVQPWHDAVTPAERCSVLANIVALMGSGAFTVLGRQVRTDVAYGPVLAVTRAAYEQAGGHAHPRVRSSLTEDIELARRVGRSELFSSRVDATFRMYPRGTAAALAGWSRTIAAGIAATRWWLALAVAAWVWSLAGGVFAGWLAYPLSAVQMWVLGRRSGRFGPVVAALYPAAVVALLIMIVGGLVNRMRRRTTWRGRAVTPA